MSAQIINLFEHRMRVPIPNPEQRRVAHEVEDECRRRNLGRLETADAINTGLGTLVFCMGVDAAITAGKNRASDYANGRVRLPDDLPPNAA